MLSLLFWFFFVILTTQFVCEGERNELRGSHLDWKMRRHSGREGGEGKSHKILEKISEFQTK